MGRDYGYINISKPRILSPGLSHDLQLLRDLEIVNARTVAELGPLPPDGLPTVPKSKYVQPQSAAIPAQAQASFENQEENAMNLSQMVTVAALAAGIAACEPSSEVGALPSTSIAPTSSSQTPAVATEASSQPKETTITEREAASATPKIPDEIRAFVPPDSTLLAYKRFDLTGDGNEDAVLIVRHPATEDSHPSFSKNPCDLLVLHGGEGGFSVASRSSKVIHCTYKMNRREEANRPDELNHVIDLKPQEIVHHYEKERPGNSTYSFRYSKESDVWHLSQIEMVHVRSGEHEVEVFEQKASYPRDFGLITMGEFDPMNDKLLAVLLKNEKEFE